MIPEPLRSKHFAGRTKPTPTLIHTKELDKKHSLVAEPVIIDAQIPTLYSKKRIGGIRKPRERTFLYYAKVSD